MNNLRNATSAIILATLLLPTMLTAAHAQREPRRKARAAASGPKVRTAIDRPQISTSSILVAFKQEAPADARSSLITRFGLSVDPRVNSPHFVRLLLPRGKASERGVNALVEALLKEPEVRVAEPEAIRYLEDVPNDTNFELQWGLDNLGRTGTEDADVDAPDAWETTKGSRSVIVAVIDSGVNYNHEDIRDNILRDDDGKIVGYNYGDDNPDPMDYHGHGSHVAGIIGAAGNNNKGVSGVCQQVSIMPLKAANSSGSILQSAAINSIDYAIAHGARVINASFGGYIFSQLELDAVRRARRAGILFVASAGNDANNNDVRPHYPSNFNEDDNVVAVASAGPRDDFSGFSNYGADSVDLAAPGEAILSLNLRNGYVENSGTSMAAPFVAGAAALTLSALPGLNARQLKARLLENVDPRLQLIGRVHTGGRLNVNRAILGFPTASLMGRVTPERREGPTSHVRNTKVSVNSTTLGINATGFYRLFNLRPGTYLISASDFARYVYPFSDGQGAPPAPVTVSGLSYKVTIPADPSDIYHLSFKSLEATKTYAAQGRVTVNGVGAGDVQVSAANATAFTVEQDASEPTTGSQTRTDYDMWLTAEFSPRTAVAVGRIRVAQNHVRSLELVLSNPFDIINPAPRSEKVPLNNPEETSYANGVLSFTHPVPPWWRVGDMGRYHLALLTSSYNVSAVVISWGFRLRDIERFNQSAKTASDGTFRITSLPATSYQITATKAGLTCVPEGFTNPVTLGPDAVNINFRCS
jgi:subtilisin family serine protease